MNVKEKHFQDSGSHFWTIPSHIAIIMDGNGRWAEQRKLPRLAGHKAGTENIRNIIEEISLQGIKHLTLYAFSTENWNRPSEEVEGIMNILKNVIEKETKLLHEQDVRILHLGSLEGLSSDLQKVVSAAIELTQHNKAMKLNVAFNYGGRAEIIEAVRKILREKLTPKDIDENIFNEYLETSGTPDPDLIIRTGGEMRLSNFLLWQSAYSEYYSTQTFWPDFGKKDLYQALKVYNQRQRRFGEIKS